MGLAKNLSCSTLQKLNLLFFCLSALGQVMLYVDGMNGVIQHIETIQWLYSLISSKVSHIHVIYTYIKPSV